MTRWYMTTTAETTEAVPETRRRKLYHDVIATDTKAPLHRRHHHRRRRHRHCLHLRRSSNSYHIIIFKVLQLTWQGSYPQRLQNIQLRQEILTEDSVHFSQWIIFMILFVWVGGWLCRSGEGRIPTYRTYLFLWMGWNLTSDNWIALTCLRLMRAHALLRGKQTLRGSYAAVGVLPRYGNWLLSRRIYSYGEETIFSPTYGWQL